MNSSLYTNLCRRIDKLGTNYLPKYNPTGRYTKVEEDDIRSYSLLVHAELETYFETICKNKAVNALKKWRANHKYNTKILLSLSCFVEQNQNIRREQTLELKLGKIIGVFNETIKNNNGIKEQNIKALLLPLGINESDMNSTWLNTLNSFGHQRGSFAHTGASVNNVPNPNDIKQDVENILRDLKDLDILIKGLK